MMAKETQHTEPMGPAAPPDLKPKHVQRAAVEALHLMRPQPSAAQINQVLEFLSELDAQGNPKHKFPTAEAAGAAAVTKAKELLAADRKLEEAAKAPEK
jgi:hypothetical protein